MDVDAFGIPAGFFGAVPEEFFGVIGRIVLLAGLLEQRVLALVWTLDPTEEQHVQAGQPAARASEGMPAAVGACRFGVTLGGHCIA